MITFSLILIPIGQIQTFVINVINASQKREPSNQNLQIEHRWFKGIFIKMSYAYLNSLIRHRYYKHKHVYIIQLTIMIIFILSID